MKTKPLVSVAMPVYNGEKWLKYAIDSILDQTFTDFELVISDNASTDDSERICREYEAKDARVKYFCNTSNIGVSENYNRVFKLSSGKYIKWATSNDYIKPTMLERCIEILEAKDDVVLCYCKTKLFNPDKNYEEEYSDNLELMQDRPSTRFSQFLSNVRLNNIMNGVIRTDALKKTGLFRRYISSDVNLMAQLTCFGKFYEVPESLFYRRMDPDSATKLKTIEEVWRYYDPDEKHRMVLQKWKYHFAPLMPTVFAPIELAEKLNILAYIFKRSYWAKSVLWEDLKMSVFRT